GSGVNNDDEHRRVDDQKDLRAFADAEPDDGDGNQRRGRDEAQEFGIGFEQAAHDRERTDGETDGNDDQRAPEETREDTHHTHGHLLTQDALLRQLDRLQNYLPGRRKEDGI